MPFENARQLFDRIRVGHGDLHLVLHETPSLAMLDLITNSRLTATKVLVTGDARGATSLCMTLKSLDQRAPLDAISFMV
jgi:hypothetical protein